MEKIKIVFVIHELLVGGAEKALFDLVTLMDPNRFDITVFAQHDTGPWDEKFRRAGIRLVYDYSCRAATWNPWKKLGNIRKKLLTALAYRKEGRGLLDLCVPGADIVVSYASRENQELIFAKNAKTVKYIHGDVASNSHYRNELTQLQAFLPRYDRIVCVSGEACQSYQAFSGRTQGVEMHFNPLDSGTVLCLAQEPVELPADVPVICAVGRLSAEKGFDRLVYIHRRLLDQGIQHKLLLVGDGMDRWLVERMIHMTATEDSVILAGHQENPYPYMKHCRFLVNSSYTEGLPVIAMEALCLGTPIVSAVPSIGELFDGETCGLITKNDTRSLEDGIRKMLTDDAFYATAKAGAEKRSAFFDGRRMAAEIEEMFIQLAQE